MSKTPYARTDRELIGRIERSAGGRAGYKQLVRELGLGGGHERRLLLEQLARITARGELVKLKDELWALPSATPERTARTRPEAAPEPASGREAQRETRDRLVAGRLDLHRDGYGFVRPNGSSDRADDLFIAPTEMHGAMQGDEVLVDEAPRDREGRRSGRILRVLTRRNPTVVGIFHYARPHGRRQSEWVAGALLKGNYVTPLDERIGTPILIPDGAEEVAASAESPHRVIGDEARTAAARWAGNADDEEPRHDPLEGLAVDVEITEFPQPGRPAKGRVIEVLGPPDAFGVDVEIVIRKHHLPHVFPADVLAEAQRSAAQTVESAAENELARRRDFRGLPIVTIDGETARDFDDAVLVRELPNGNTELQVHIADVSHYVRPATALDLEARLRGTSVYFPDRAVPMLPPELSSGMCSLRPDEDRFVLSCVMEIDREGEVAGYEVGEGIIRSARRMTYTQVQACLDAATAGAAGSRAQADGADRRDESANVDASGGARRADDAGAASAVAAAAADRARADQETRLEFLELAPEFDRMLELALRLNRKRKRRGSIDFDLPEPVVRFDPQGNMEAIVRSERGWSHRLIEEFMLSANECVATWIEQQAVPGIYRIHEMPDPKRIVEFEETAGGFGYSLGLGNLPVRRLTMKSDRREVRQHSARGQGGMREARSHEIAERIPVTPQMYQRLTAKIAGQPEERILSYLMLRSLKQARYSEQNEGHFALASPSYTHFTSPIRRYPDLIVHRLLRALLEGGADPRGGPIHSGDRQPWQAELERSQGRHDTVEPRRAIEDEAAPLPAEELEAIAAESSQAERRADDAERELIEWKKIKFMQDRVGEEFEGTILSCTKFGFFVELDEMFIEGLVPLASLESFGTRDNRDGARGFGDSARGFSNSDRYVFRDTDHAIVGQRSGRVFRIGLRVRVLLDRIDRQQRRLQFAVLEVLGEQERVLTGTGSLRRSRKVALAGGSGPRPGKGKRGKSKQRVRNGKAKGKRR